MIRQEENYKPGFPFTHKHFNTVFRRLYLKAPENFSRTRIPTPDGDFIDLDLNLNGNDKLVILVHGLEGSSHSEYIKIAANYLQNKGYDSIAVNQRGCSGEDNLLPYSYHSGKTDDLDNVIRYIRDRFTYYKIYLVGYSLGGNQILKYLGEKGSDAQKFIRAAVAVSVPVDLKGSAETLAQPRNRFYTNRFLQTLKAKSLQKLEKFPDSGLDKKKILESKNFFDFDNAVTAPVFGFKDAADYYQQSSSKNFIPEVRVPTVLLNAWDDPFLSKSCFPTKTAKDHRFFTLITTKYGGHVGFNTSFIPQKNNWLEAKIEDFLQKS